MNRMIRAATAAAILSGGLGSVGCVHTDRANRDATNGTRCANWIDPCYPERYSYAAREAVLYPFAQQAYNGHVVNQTIWNYYFVPGTDQLTPAGAEKLDSLARVRPAPDPRLYIQTARDLTETGDPVKLADARTELDAKRGAAIQKYMSNQPAFGGRVAYEVFVHDPDVPGIYSGFADYAWNYSLRGYRGGVSGGGTGTMGGGGGGMGGMGGMGGAGVGGGGAGGYLGGSTGNNSGNNGGGNAPATGFGTR